MNKKKTAYISLLIIAAIVFGKGVHLLLIPGFWGAEPLLIRVEAVLRVMLGLAIYLAARKLKPEAVSG